MSLSTGQLLFLIWIALACGLPLLWIALVSVVRWRNRRNVVDLTEWRELKGAIQRHPSNVRRIDRQVRVR